MKTFESLLSNDLVALLVILIIPLIPAIVCFKILNSSAKVQGKAFETGPFKGLQYDISGAAAFYFLILVACIYFVSLRARMRSMEVWRVIASVELPTHVPVSRIQDVVAYVSKPKEYSIEGDGTFQMDIVVRRNEKGQLEYPNIILQLDTLSNVIHLEPSPFVKNYEKEIDGNTIRINREKIVLK